MTAFFKGLQSNVAGIIIYKGSSFFIYENMLAALKRDGRVTSSTSQQFLASGTAAIAGQFVTYPLDVIKRKYMVIKDRQKQLV